MRDQPPIFLQGYQPIPVLKEWAKGHPERRWEIRSMGWAYECRLDTKLSDGQKYALTRASNSVEETAYSALMMFEHWLERSNLKEPILPKFEKETR